jgi:hypothetical protein
MAAMLEKLPKIILFLIVGVGSIQLVKNVPSHVHTTHALFSMYTIMD